MPRRPFINILDDETLKNIVKNSISRTEVKEKLKVLGANYSSEFVRDTITRLKLSITHFSGRWVSKSAERYPIEQYLVKNSSRRGNDSLKKRLWKLGLLRKECYWCKLTMWRDLPAPLELDHVNGNPYDNRLENLRILCPNCHAQTETANGKNTKKYKNGAPGRIRTDVARF